MLSLNALLIAVLLSLFLIAKAGLPSKIYGVNLGSWLVLEPWMLPKAWVNMGGELCGDCSACIASEFAFAQAHPDIVDEKFRQHWDTWFTQEDVNQLVALGINTVRIPIGYWIIESLVDRTTEFYPRGGIHHLRRGLAMLKKAGISAILDHHALPGVQSPNQMFAGRCTANVQFYTPYNYQRALTWTAIMTALAHRDPAFSSVIAIEAVNEPVTDAYQTPGFGDFQQHFVKTVRVMEMLLGISDTLPLLKRHCYIRRNTDMFTLAASFTSRLDRACDLLPPDVRIGLRKAIPIFEELRSQGFFDVDSVVTQWEPLYTNFMDISWQYNNPPNPANAQDGPQAYDSHIYYSYGGVAEPNEYAYLKHICNLNRLQADENQGNTPLWFGEWALSTQFNASDEFLYKWADAQKLAYSQGAGWIFWNFKVETIDDAGKELGRQWSYFMAAELGFFTKDPSAFHNPHVCDPYRS